MNARLLIASATVIAVSAAALAQQAPPQSPNMTFFVASTGSGKGADLGGLAGADQRCQQLAQAAGSTGKTWHAYLSTQAANGQPAINARDRIGTGPWQNAKGVVIAKSIDELHGANNLTKQTALSEKGSPTKGRGDSPNEHDALTGSTMDGRAFPAGEDRTGKKPDQQHPEMGDARAYRPRRLTRRCGIEVVECLASLARIGWWLQPSGPPEHRGAGLFYCFAIN